MADTLMAFNAQRFANKREGCFVFKISGKLYKRFGKVLDEPFKWTKNTVYKKCTDGSFLEHVNTPTGSWYKVNDSSMIKRLTQHVR